MVRAQNVQVDDGAKIVLGAPVQRVIQQLKRLKFFVSLFIPHLLLIDWNSQMVESKPGEELDVLFREPGEAIRAAAVALR